MHPVVSDRLHVHSRVVGASDQTSEIIEIPGPGGAPPYLVRRDDRHEALAFPGSGCVRGEPEEPRVHPRVIGSPRWAHRTGRRPQAQHRWET